MFTGLVEDMGCIREVVPLPRGSGVRLGIASSLFGSPPPLGASVAVDGACLTVVASSPGQVSVEVGPETQERTTLGKPIAGRQVHLERALCVGDRLGGHIVTGHVDGVGIVEKSGLRGDNWDLWIAIPDMLLRYVVVKGAVCVDGVSLTVNEVSERGFSISLVPHTQTHTHLVKGPVSRGVNIEVDLVAKHIEKLVTAYLPSAKTGITLEKLKEFGYARGD
ncbi:MAG TPA: riboflavin synthase [Pseudomonadota bacterium]|mgnify:CR=1 FL=1|nr:riboflavin synthase [Pseudomonadota bacterium]